MAVNWEEFTHYLSTQKQVSFSLISVSSVSGGDINQAFHLHTTEGDYFLKINALNQQKLLQAEANNLTALEKTLSITLPKLITVGMFQDFSWLLLEYLPLSRNGDDLQRGKDLALLHHHLSDNKKFGWDEDNYIGRNLQRNLWTDNWISFYAEQRLQPQLTEAVRKSNNLALADLGEQLISKLEQFFDTYQPEPSYLHGDLWGGNSRFLVDGSAVFFDPASYIGDRETDIAMTEMFGGFSNDFYKGYNQVFPLDKGYQQRKDLYNLYHYLEPPQKIKTK